MRLSHLVAPAALTALFAGTPLQAADWPGWRGPARDGVVADFTPPKAWPKQLTELWRVEVGEGHSSPIVVGDNVYLHTRQKDDEAVLCLALADGKQRWRSSYAAPYKMHAAAVGHGKG